MQIETQPLQELPSDVIDQIAAGEVVERPSHLLKELIENSLDAGASELVIEVHRGGRDVVVRDNGWGIRSEDLLQALRRHTTSKITSTDDLWKLSTYGFRGEALASISAVSRLSLSSRTPRTSEGFRIESEFGRPGPVEPIGHSIGTRVQIRDLFENVPARMKFMKSAASEVSQMRMVVKAMALANYKCSFQFFVEGSLDLHLPTAASRLERAEQVLGVKPLYEGRATRETVTAYSVMADPNQTAKTSKNIWILAQNRWIQDRALQTAIVEAYRTMLMHGEYPFVVTWVETAPEEIDVNIHPTKSQVKFANPGLAFRAASASVRETLERAPWVAQILRTQESTRSGASAPSVESAESLTFEAPEFRKTQYQMKPHLGTLHSPRAMEFPSMQEIRSSAESRETLSQNSVDVQSWAGLQILAQADLTYLVCQKRGGLVFVDQHAAHERVLFEKIMKSWKTGKIEVQEFLFPLSMDLSVEKKEALLLESGNFAKLGVHLEEMGPQTVGVKAAPMWIRENTLPQILDKAASQMAEHGGSFVFEKYVADLAATMACHSAIRAGQALSQDEMQALLVSMDEFAMSSFCPHGRPVSVEYGFDKLEKDFGRILS